MKDKRLHTLEFTEGEYEFLGDVIEDLDEYMRVSESCKTCVMFPPMCARYHWLIGVLCEDYDLECVRVGKEDIMICAYRKEYLLEFEELEFIQ